MRNAFFNAALNKLSGHAFRDQKVAYKVMRIVNKIEAESPTAEKLYQKMLKQFATLDEKGDFVPRDGRPDTFVVAPEMQDGYAKALEEFETLAYDMKWRKLALSDLADLRFSAVELAALAPVLHFPEEE